MEEGKETTTATLPAVLSVAREINEPRYPSFMGILKANKAIIPSWTGGDLGLSAGQVGKAGSVMVPARSRLGAWRFIAPWPPTATPRAAPEDHMLQCEKDR